MQASTCELGAPAHAIFIKLPAVTVLFDEGDSVSTSPAAEPD